MPDTPLAGASIAGTTEVDEDLEAMFEDLAAPDPADTLDAPETPADSGVVEIAWTPIPVETKPSRKRPPDPAAADATSLTPADIDAIAQAVVARLSERILREIAWDVVPDLAEVIVRERLRELEREP